MPSQRPSPTDLEGLEAYFTDVVHLRKLFREMLAEAHLPRRLLCIHGVGGVGKSSLLRMFRLHCKSVRIAVAFASGDEARSVTDVLTQWQEDLKADRVVSSAFMNARKRYRAVQFEVDARTRPGSSGALPKIAAKTVEAAVSAIPVVGPLAGALVGVKDRELVDWLGSFLEKPEVDLYLNPARTLTQAFLDDLTKASAKRRVTLMLDTFEQVSSLERWLCDVSRGLPDNVLLVIAGRAMPDWTRQWPGWLAQTEVQELQPMEEGVMAELVRRYYSTQVGGEPDPAQVQKIVGFARGLPLAITSAVRLWVLYRMDFEAAKPQVIADLVDRLMEGAPPDLVRYIEIAAAVRWFDRDILRALSGETNVSAVYDELRRFPFVRPRIEGLALHDTVREMIDENLRLHDPGRHRELHEHAAAYYQARLAPATMGELDRLQMEHLYHRVRADEETGLQLFQQIAEELVRHRQINRLQVVMNDLNAQGLARRNSNLWRKYYDARLAQLEGRLADAEKTYQAIGDDSEAETRLRAYALCDWGQLYGRLERVIQVGGYERALSLLEQSLQMMPQMDSKLVFVLSNLADVYLAKGEWARGTELLERQLAFLEDNHDHYGVVYTLASLKNVHLMTGDWRKAYDAVAQGQSILQSLRGGNHARLRLLGNKSLVSVWAGSLAETEQSVRGALALARNEGDGEGVADSLRELGLLVGSEGRHDEALSCLKESIQWYETLGGEYTAQIAQTLGFLGFVLLRAGRITEAEQQLKQSLSMKQEYQDNIGVQELLIWLGQLHEIRALRGKSNRIEALADAEASYRMCCDSWRAGRLYFDCGAATGLARVKHGQGEHAAIPALLAEAEQLAQRHEYNDHLASLRLTQGHVAWSCRVSGLSYGFDAALHYYQHSLTYALRYNRFLLDEVLSGRPQGSPLRPIIPHCLGRGEEGRRMLAVLQEWWTIGVNHTGTPRPDTISPIPQGVPLLDGECMAREREPSNGAVQKPLTQQIEEALSSAGKP